MGKISRDFYKPFRESTTVHAYNHSIDMLPGTKLFGEFEKALFSKTCQDFIVKYALELTDLAIMDNHFHLILHCPVKKSTPAESAVKYNTFHKSKKPISADHPLAINLAKNSNNISEYLREVQIAFSKEFNRTRDYPRQGAVWRGPFRCQLIDSDYYAFFCMYYVAMNPVRAGYVKNPEDYAFSSYGQWCQTGKHPNEEMLIKFLKYLNCNLSLEQFKTKMELEMKRMQQWDEVKKCKDQDLRKELTLKLSEACSEIREFYENFSEDFCTHKLVLGRESFKEECFTNWKERQSATPG